jgi:plasmid stabilization system protein ParE
MANRKVSWDRHALRQFNKAILYIAEDSIQNAEAVSFEIIAKIEELQAFPEKYPPDKYKVENNGDYRAFELHHLRVAYLRNTRREPQSY